VALGRMVRVIEFVFAAIVGAACGQELSVAQRQQWHADSARYLAALAAWQHDSSVVDSIITAAHADTMWALHRNMIRSVAPMQYPQLIECESQRLEGKYGSRIADEIERRAKRDAFAAATDSQISLMNRRLPSGMALEIYGDICGRNTTLGAPTEIAGVSAINAPRRPEPPPRPP
jgi:hypothetical protein